MSALTFPAILSAAGLSAPSLPSPASASTDSLPDLVWPDFSEPAALPRPSEVPTLSESESDAGVHGLRANSWVASEWRETEQQGQYDPVIVNIITTISDDRPVSLHPVPSPDPAPTAPTTTSAFRARKPFCFRCHWPGHVVKDCRGPHPLCNRQTARCSSGPPPTSNHLPTQGWDTHHDAWDIANPVDQCLDPTANAFRDHRQLLLNCLHDVDEGIDKLKERRMYWSDQLWAMGWKEPPCPSKERVRNDRCTWADEEDHPRHPSWGLPGWDY